MRAPVRFTAPGVEITSGQLDGRFPMHALDIVNAPREELHRCTVAELRDLPAADSTMLEVDGEMTSVIKIGSLTLSVKRISAFLKPLNKKTALVLSADERSLRIDFEESSYVLQGIEK